MINSPDYHRTFDILCGIVRAWMRHRPQRPDPWMRHNYNGRRELPGAVKRELTRLRIIRELSTGR